MSSASHALAPSRNGGQAGNRNAVKNTEKFLEPYTWATVDTVDQELTDEELVEVRGQRIRLKKTIHQLKGNDPRRPQAEKCLEILDRRIVKGAKRHCRHTEKSAAIDEAEAQVRVCEGQQDSGEVRMPQDLQYLGDTRFVHNSYAERPREPSAAKRISARKTTTVIL